MKRHWGEHELAEHWSLNADERELLANRTDRSRLGLAILLKLGFDNHRNRELG